LSQHDRVEQLRARAVGDQSLLALLQPVHVRERHLRSHSAVTTAEPVLARMHAAFDEQSSPDNITV